MRENESEREGVFSTLSMIVGKRGREGWSADGEKRIGACVRDRSHFLETAAEIQWQRRTQSRRDAETQREGNKKHQRLTQRDPLGQGAGYRARHGGLAVISTHVGEPALAWEGISYAGPSSARAARRAGGPPRGSCKG